MKFYNIEYFERTTLKHFLIVLRNGHIRRMINLKYQQLIITVEKIKSLNAGFRSR